MRCKLYIPDIVHLGSNANGLIIMCPNAAYKNTHKVVQSIHTPAVSQHPHLSIFELQCCQAGHDPDSPAIVWRYCYISIDMLLLTRQLCNLQPRSSSAAEV